MPRYEWKEGFPRLADAEEVMQELFEIGLQSSGVTPEVVLEHARNEDSTLHGFFEWDDSEAAEKYRIIQARQLLKAIVVVPDSTGPNVTVRAIVRVGDGNEKGKYWETQQAMSDGEMRERVPADAVRDLQAMAQRYRALSKYSERLEIGADKLDDLATWLTELEVPV